ncbi:hypothetical protein AVEN_134941-1 [Araneus ventricosus]|uniref:Uncharacterized protein n=1 Tax=Araneus ventricosus TaxID=182803 RepID=A0A4Y2CHA8_ARAVE|nr:hypothetical protein AVEN_134941-1 [Araneus ventricosus]
MQPPSNSRKVTSEISFANIATGNTKEQAISAPTLNPPPPKNDSTVPREILDNSFTKALSAVLFFMKEDWVSPTLLLQAFKNALPALREAQTGTDRAYFIFREYVQISSPEDNTA